MISLNPKSLEVYFTRAIKVLLFIVPFLSLWISKSMLFPYITGRNFGFRILIEIAFVLWIGLIVLDHKYLPKKSYLLWAVLAFFVVIGLANLFGVDSYNSFWSRYERMEGYFGLLHFGLYFLIVSSVLRTKKEWKLFFSIILIAGFFVGYVALDQKISGEGSIQGGSRVDGTIGNPTYLAGFSLFLIGLSLILLYDAEKKWLKYLYGGSAIFFFIVMYLTASRGPLLAFIASVFLFLIIFLFFGEREEKEKYKRYVIGALLFLSLAVSGFWILRDSTFIQSSPILSRFANISFVDKTTRARFMVWDMAWEGFKERPILGWGQENFSYVFAKHYNPKLFDQEPYFDRAHNAFFDWLVGGGLLGILAYLSLFVFSFLILKKIKKQNKISFYEALILGLIFFAYFIQNLLVFDNFTTYFLFFSLLAYLQMISTESLSSPAKTFRFSHNSRAALGFSGAAAVLIALPFYFGNIVPIRASQQLINTMGLLNNSQTTLQEVRESFEKTLAYNTFANRETSEQLIRLAIQIGPIEGISNEEKINFIKFAITHMEKIVERHPNDLRPRLFLGDIYNYFNPADPTFPAKGEEHIQKALTISPTRQTTYFLLADNLIAQGKTEEAISVLQEAVEIEPSFIVGQANLAFISLTFSQEQITDKVLNDLKNIIKSDHRSDADAAALRRVGDGYVAKNKVDKAIEWYKLVILINPETAEYHANIAALYADQGDKENAIKHAKKAAELDPANYEEKVAEFLKALGVKE